MGTFRSTVAALAATCLAATSATILTLPAVAGPATVRTATAQTVTVAAQARPAPVQDPDRYSTTPTGWGWHTNVSPATMTAFIDTGQRITDLEVNTASGSPTFSAAYVTNSGSYQRGWWWYFGQSASQVSAKLSANDARLLDIEPYLVGGTVKYAVVMVKNTGDAAKAWGWYSGTTLAQISSYASDNNMRLVDSDRYKVGSSTRYSAIFVKNTGIDAKSWWHYYGLSATSLSSKLSTNEARLTNLERNADGTFDAIMTRGGASGAWWYLTGRTSAQVTAFVDQVGGRIFHVDSRVVSGVRYFDVILLDNTDAETRRIRNLVSAKMSGSWGFYVKKVNGSVATGLNANTVFEPASMIKIVHAVHALRDVQAGNRSVTSLISWRQHPSFDARYRSDSGFYNNSSGGNDKDVCAYDSNGAAVGTSVSDQLGPVILDYMLKDSDNRATDAIVNLYGFSALNQTMDIAAMTRSQLVHRVGCGSTWADDGAYHNQLTLVDAGKIYEGVQSLQLLDSTRRANLYAYLSGGPIATDSGLAAMITQEATAAGLTSAERASFLSQVVTRSKGGSYGLCPDDSDAACDPPTAAVRTTGGLIFLPFKTTRGTFSTPYVYGRFLNTPLSCSFDSVEANTCTALNNASSGMSTVSVEMFRASVKAALATW